MSQFKIHRRSLLADSTHEYWVEAPLVAAKHVAGQFVIVRSHDHGERIPLTVAGTDKDLGLIRLIVQETGKSTIEMAGLNAGDSFLDVVGPLGRATDIANWGSLIVVAGGVGKAPLLPVVSAAKEAGNEVCAIIGAKTADRMSVMLVDEYSAICDELRLCTDDGTMGEKGFVTETLEKWLKEGKHFDQAIIAGPVMMMKYTALVAKKWGLPAMASLNPIMVDGTGMCGACRVTVHGKTKFACVDGPDFDAHGVDFDELELRNQTYRKQEKMAVEAWEAHHCNIGLTKGGIKNAE